MTNSVINPDGAHSDTGRNAEGGLVKPVFPVVTGDYASDCEAGRDYAQKIVTYMSAMDFPPLLNRAIKEVQNASRKSEGIAVGFFQQIAVLAMAGL